MSEQDSQKTEIDATPTKSFFVDMLVRDIALEQAILDLIDNSVDGAKRFQNGAGNGFEGKKVDLEINSEQFRILDNCGGFDTKTARDYAFRFGRPPGTPSTPHSIGQFGVGMKRALFKFGRRFSVKSATTEEKWAININVTDWEKRDDNWHFPWADFGSEEVISQKKPGTEIIVTELKEEVSGRFSSQQFTNNIMEIIKSKHRQFISEGLSISVNGQHIDASNLYLLMTDQLQPGVDFLNFGEKEEEKITVRIVAGLGISSPREAGWYVICNGRVVLEADRRTVTGWGLIEEETNQTIIPSFHNQFARFRGIVSFDSPDSSKVPWNTTKTDVDQDNPVWQKTFARMMEMMRPVISFLNELDRDIDEYTREQSPLFDYVNKAPPAKSESFTTRRSFAAPARGSISKSKQTTKIQYSRPVEDVELLKEALNLNSAKAVGELTFDLILRKEKGE